MRGWNLRILAIDLYCAADSGYSASLISTTSSTIAQPQLWVSLCNWVSNQWIGLDSTVKMP